MKNNIIKTGINITGTFKSLNGLGEGTKIELAYRDIATGKFTKITETRINDEGLYSFFAEDVIIFGNGTELALLFNGKYRIFEMKKEDFVGKTGFKDIYILDTNLKRTGKFFDDIHTENFIADSKAKAQNILFDELVQEAMMKQKFNGDLYKEEIHDNLNGNSTDSNENFYEKQIDLIGTRKNKIETMIKKGASKKEIFNYAFDELEAGKALKEQGFSKQAISYIRDNGFNNSIKIIQKTIIPERYQEIIKHFEKIDNMTTDEFIGRKKEEKTYDSGENKNENSFLGKLNFKLEKPIEEKKITRKFLSNLNIYNSNFNYFSNNL